MITIINRKDKTIKRVDEGYIDLCHEAFILPADAIKKKLTEKDLMLFIRKYDNWEDEI